MLETKRILWAFASLMLATLACTLLGGTEVAEGELSVVINTPADNSEVMAGQEVQVQITINDPAGVVNRQELIVNDEVVATAEAVAPDGAPAFSMIMPFTPPEPGTYNVSAVAYGSDGSASQPATIVLVATGEGEEEEPEEPEEEEEEQPQPTATVNPTPVPDVRGCTNDMRYVSDVTIPDGTEMSPGQAFTKTWEIRNSGTCDWGGYRLVYHSDNKMGGPDTVSVPAVSAGQTVQVSVNLTAPTTPGTYFSRWTMRSADGDLFGNIIFAEIEVTGDGGGDGDGGGGDGPDLEVKSVTTNPGEPEAGEITTYVIEVRNIGNEDAGASTLSGAFEGAGTATVPVGALGPDEIEVVQMTQTIPDKGSSTATFTADANDDVDEADESNNTLEIDFTYVVVLGSGTLNTSEFSSFDFDAVSTQGGFCGGGHDFHWEGDSPANRILSPCNGASIKLMGADAVGYDECSTESLSGSDLNIDGETGSWACVETSDGNIAAFHIDDLGSAVDPLILTYTVYEP